MYGVNIFFFVIINQNKMSNETELTMDRINGNKNNTNYDKITSHFQVVTSLVFSSTDEDKKQ